MTQDDLLPDWDGDAEWAPPRDADGTLPHASIPFCGLFDGPEIAAPATWL